MLSIYCASPISGLTPDQVIGYYDEIKEKLRGFSVLSPMTAKEELRTELIYRAKDYRHPVATNHAIFERDQWMVRQSDIVLVDLTHAKDRVSIGCMMELGWASMLGKHTVVVLPQEDNVHQHAFVLEAADIVFKSIEEAIEYIKRF